MFDEPEVRYGGISQKEYCDILFLDLGYSESAQRRGWLRLRFGKAYLDELSPYELGQALDKLLEEKGASADG
jgi:hypothetical protein